MTKALKIETAIGPLYKFNIMLRRMFEHMCSKTSYMTLPQYVFLHAIDGQPNSSQTEISHYLGTDTATIMNLTGRMIKAGYIMRSDNPKDARKYTLSLTKRGKEILDEGEVIVQKLLRDMKSIDGFNTMMDWMNEINQLFGTAFNEQAKKNDRKQRHEDDDNTVIERTAKGTYVDPRKRVSKSAEKPNVTEKPDNTNTTKPISAAVAARKLKTVKLVSKSGKSAKQRAA